MVWSNGPGLNFLESNHLLQFMDQPPVNVATLTLNLTAAQMASNFLQHHPGTAEITKSSFPPIMHVEHLQPSLLNGVELMKSMETLTLSAGKLCLQVNKDHFFSFQSTQK